MFQGRNVQLTQISKNQFEYKTAQTIVRRSGQEIAALIDEERAYAERMLRETTFAKQALSRVVANDNVTILSAPPKPSLPPVLVQPSPEVPSAPKIKTTRRRKTQVEVVASEPSAQATEVVQVAEPAPPPPSESKPKRKPHGLAYLAWLETQRAS
jgi:hypothetical protein